MDTAYEFLLDKLSMQARAGRIPINGAFELTSRCNFHCRMCYIHTQNEDCKRVDLELTADQWIKLAKDARDAGMLNLVLTGGEIFLRQDFEVIYESIAKMGFNIYLYTNASLIGSKKAKWLGKIPPSVMEITLYGASAETYDKVCGNGKAYGQVISAIDMLLAEGINIKLKTTITNDNINDYDALAEFSYQRSITLGTVNYLFPVPSIVNGVENCRLTPESLIDFQETVGNTNTRLSGIYMKDLPKPQSSEYKDKLVHELSSTGMDLKESESAFGCNAGSSDFWITWDGRMLPCGMMEEPSIRPLEIGFSNAWDKLNKQCSNIPVCQECRDCDNIDYCLVCPAKLKRETGSYDQPAQYLCKLAQLAKESALSQDAI